MENSTRCMKKSSAVIFLFFLLCTEIFCQKFSADEIKKIYEKETIQIDSKMQNFLLNKFTYKIGAFGGNISDIINSGTSKDGALQLNEFKKFKKRGAVIAAISFVAATGGVIMIIVGETAGTALGPIGGGVFLLHGLCL